jgi:hypothetical protein
MLVITVTYWDGSGIRTIQAPKVTYGQNGNKIILREWTRTSREVMGKTIKVIPLRNVISVDYKNK